ncbi:MAG: hypothetical protein MRY57_03970 [Candidatus Pacebacteria bacterium]|nr:hypothetical protein [Candidatus Paceibacterota bacterium]
MKKLIFLFALVFAFTFNVNAQDVAMVGTNSEVVSLENVLETKPYLENLSELNGDESGKHFTFFTEFTQEKVGQFVPFGLFKNEQNLVLLVGTPSNKFYIVYSDLSKENINIQETTQEKILEIRKNS